MYFCTAKCPRSLMDKMKDSGSLAVGSIPAGGAQLVKKTVSLHSFFKFQKKRRNLFL